MASTNIPSNTDVKKVRVQWRTPADGQCNVDVDQTQLQELLTMLIDCKYKMAGCIVNDYVKDIKKHERRCLYREQPCSIPSNKDACKNVQAKNLVEHWTEHHDVDCMSIEENFFSLPIDLEQEVQLSKMVTIGEDIVLCRFKSEGNTLNASLVFIKSSNPNVNYKVTLMADNVAWDKHKIQIFNTFSNYSEYNEESAIFDVEKLMKIRNVFNSITVRIDWSSVVQENIAQDDQFLQKILCRSCGDFLTSTYYECCNVYAKHLHCNKCYGLKESTQTCNYDGQTDLYCKLTYCDDKMNQTALHLTLIDSLKKYEFPCCYKSLGCNQFMPRFTSKHELLCPFKTFICEFHKNQIFDKYLEFITHLQENHPDIIINSNVYVTDKSKRICYMFAFGSVFLCRMIGPQTYHIEWILTSILNQNFIFKATFVGDGRSITLSTNTDPRKVNYKINCYKSIYNTIKKEAAFNVTENELPNVSKITLEIQKK